MIYRIELQKTIVLDNKKAIRFATLNKTKQSRVENLHSFSPLPPLLGSMPDQNLYTRQDGQKRHRFSKALGATARTTARLVTMRPADKTATTTILPLLAGNLPLMT